MKLSTKSVLAALLAAIGFAAAPTASASPLTYLDSLTDHGLVISDTTAAIRTGFLVCQALETNRGDVVAQSLYENATDITTFEEAAIIVVTAVEELCPNHDHRGTDA